MDLEWTRFRRAFAAEVAVDEERVRGLSGRSRLGERIFIDYLEGGHAAWLVMRVAICASTDMDPRLTLIRSGTLAFAAIVLVDDEYFLRVAVPGDSVEAHDPRQLLTLTLDAARALQPRAALTSEPQRVFGHYAS